MQHGVEVRGLVVTEITVPWCLLVTRDRHDRLVFLGGLRIKV